MIIANIHQIITETSLIPITYTRKDKEEDCQFEPGPIPT